MIESIQQPGGPGNLRAQRAGVYGLYGRLWLHEIDSQLLGELQDNSVNAALQSVGVKTQELEIDQLDRLAADYCRLFVAPLTGVAPYQSVVTSRRHHAGATESMNNYLSYIQIPRSARQLVDHFGFQMQVMSAILASTATGEDENLLQELECRFFHDHILWAERLCTEKSPIAETDFYRSLLVSTSNFIQLESDLLSPVKHANH